MERTNVNVLIDRKIKSISLDGRGHIIINLHDDMEISVGVDDLFDCDGNRFNIDDLSMKDEISIKG